METRSTAPRTPYVPSEGQLLVRASDARGGLDVGLLWYYHLE